MKNRIITTALLVGAALPAFADTAQDSNLWLEEIQGEKALEWVQKTNSATDETLGADPLYKEIYEDALSALNSKDKLPEISQKGDWIYYLKKSEDNPRGIYQRTSLADFKSGQPKWQKVLDIDALSKTDNVKWVFRSMNCLEPANEKCLVSLAPGGSDAVVLKEFDAKTLSFVKDGFQLPEAKMQVSWIDADHLFVGTDFGEGSMTDSGYPRITKIWQRGTSIDKADTIFETDKSSVWLGGTRYRGEEEHVDMVYEALTFWTANYHQLVDGKPIQLTLPETARIEGLFKGKLVVSLKEDWTFAAESFKQGAVILVAPGDLHGKPTAKGVAELLVQSKPDAIVESVAVMKDSILLTVLEDVKSKIYRYQPTDKGWDSQLVALPESGNIGVQTTNDDTGEFIVRFEGFITPPSLYSVDQGNAVKLVQQQSATFDSSNLKVEQYFTESKDGTRVPYFVVMNKDTKLDGSNPTHIFSYGGFRVSLTPSYSGSYEALNGIYGKAWLERGGVFVLANIRGGAEYGPAWHAAALLENRNKSYEDFEAVAEDLIKRKITSAKHLGIEGRSNGGLLVGATMVRRPDLYGAIICGVPLLDMKRYHKLLAGASWMAEYGNPDTDDWSFIKTYSPYQNLKKDVKYPPIFFFTSTLDDRVHPGHARKMAARMLEYGNQVDYYENTEGGHKGSSTSEQTAKRVALAFTHLWRHLK